MVTSTRRFVFSLVLRFVLEVLVLLALRSPHLGEKRAGPCAFQRMFVLRVLVYVSFLFLVLSGIWLRREFGIPWMFFLPFLQITIQPFALFHHNNETRKSSQLIIFSVKILSFVIIIFLISPTEYVLF